MKKKYARLLVGMIMVVCFVGVLARPNSRPTLLENDESLFFEDGSVFIPDDNVPMGAMPELDMTDGSNEAEGADLYAGLDDTQIKYVNEVLQLVNEARAKEGLPALALDPGLRQAAQVRASECVGTFSHTRPNGASYKTAIAEAGVQSGYTGENVATGHTSARQVVQGWLNSPGHRENVLNENFTRIGIGLEKNVGNPYGGYSWAQLFVK